MIIKKILFKKLQLFSIYKVIIHSYSSYGITGISLGVVGDFY